MKSLIIIASILSASLFAGAAEKSCVAEAQIIAKVGELRGNSTTSCRVFISSVVMYNENMTCPLDISEVMQKGIEIGLKNGHDCEYDSDIISGVLVQNSAGIISLEN